MDTVLRMLFDSIPRECSTNAYKTTLLSEVGSLLRSCRNICFANCRILWIFQRHSRGLTVQRSDFFQPKAVSLCYMQQVFWLIAPLLGLPILSTVTLKIMNIGLRITAAGLCQNHTGFPKTECGCKGTTKNAHTQVMRVFFYKKIRAVKKNKPPRGGLWKYNVWGIVMDEQHESWNQNSLNQPRQTCCHSNYMWGNMLHVSY